MDIKGIPLICILCTKFLPLNAHLVEKFIHFKSDENNRSALQYAVEADDVRAAHWCLKNGIENTKDNLGNTAILDAIRLGRKRCFLLCMEYRFYDSKAAHIAVLYNRSW
jgi:ankyrin repeat protein